MGAQVCVKHAKISSKMSFFVIFSSLVTSLYFFDTAQDCSLGQRLTSSRGETSKNKFVAKIEAETIFLLQNLSCL